MVISPTISYPGLDMVGGLPFRLREPAGGGGGCICASGSVTRVRFIRRLVEVRVGSGGWFASEADALRFRVEGVVCEAAVGAGSAGAAVCSATWAALEDALVALGDMICEYGFLVEGVVCSRHRLGGS